MKAILSRSSGLKAISSIAVAFEVYPSDPTDWSGSSGFY